MVKFLIKFIFRIIRIDQAKLGLAREYLVQGANNKEVQAYYRFNYTLYISRNKIKGINKQT